MSRAQEMRDFLWALGDGESAASVAKTYIHDPGTAADVADYLESTARILRRAWRLGDAL